MQTKVQKWGNSIALRIPKSFAREIGLVDEAAIDLTLEDGKLVITPITVNRYSLHDLVSQITDENLHGEIDTGDPVGGEAW